MFHAPRLTAHGLAARRHALLHLLLGAPGLVACVSTGGSEDAGPPPGPPTVAVEAQTYVAAGTSVSIPATASDPNGDPLTYRWEQVTGGAATVTGADTATLVVTAPAVKTDLDFRVTVTDPSGESATATARVLVRRVTSSSPFPLQSGRTFSYAFREQVYGWVAATDPMDPDNPATAGTATLTVTGPVPANGIDVWTLTIAESGQGGGASCNAAEPLTSCGSPNLQCPASGTCATNKALVATVEVAQMDNQLYRWVGVHDAAQLVVDPARMVSAAQIFDGFELFSGLARVQPQLPETPLRYLGSTALSIPGTAPSGSMAGTTAPCVEVYDGTRRTDVLTPYRMTRAFYEAGKGLVFFQQESVPTGFEQAGQVGYRDTVLVGITPPP